MNGRGPESVAKGLFNPLMAKWTSFALVPTDFIADGDVVLPLGNFTGGAWTTGKHADAHYAQIWTVEGGLVTRFRQYIDTLAVAEARRA